MTLDKQLHNARIVSSVAATVISLACGTNYVYSAWAPQFADRLLLSATESNLIGLFGNLGMYSMGVPVGMLVDGKGPRPAVMLGSLLLGIGYWPLHTAYNDGHGSIPLMCFFSYLTGLGGCMAFAAAVKTSALNWPHHRGSATAFPMAAFGLSAFFFALVGSVLFPGDPGRFLELLATGTFGLTFVGFFFLRVYPHSHYHAVAQATDESNLSGSQQLHRTTSHESRKSRAGRGPPIEPDIRGLALLKNFEFWQLFVIMGILSGIGLMTINNIGNDATALWKHWDDSIDDKSLVLRQQLHVSILSIGSFTGRLLSGTGSDFLVKVLHASRVWCLVFAAGVFSVAQICALNIENPHFLGFVSGLSGLGYGFLFGVFPSIVAESFGIHALSQNWGFMTLSPVISSNIFNIFYGLVFDAHSVVEPDGSRDCTEGLECYRSAYIVTICACALGVVVSLAVIWVQRREQLKENSKDRSED
ncbi:major facilitator superfamily domain-containing protein [Truncatella angustata]|uniref:Major facilitator superfamily domain-containing protein n=1 Tax=Truncatella angustata TaxID=152316 RepID=A0A9P8UWK0_9PEZI|nr:major facilitator superfamily domain-containing protein [Truncatella angustata]KAH6659728.1 major facilitator superfamily domain-containing protein [Truncatella angustata]